VNTRQLLDAYFDVGSKHANEMLKAAGQASLVSKDAVSAGDAANLLMLHLLVERELGQLSEGGLGDAARKMDAIEIPDGSRVVYNLLLLDLARERGVSLTFAKTTSASGNDLDWDLMRRLRRATPTFSNQIDELIQAHAKRAPPFK